VAQLHTSPVCAARLSRESLTDPAQPRKAPSRLGKKDSSQPAPSPLSPLEGEKVGESAQFFPQGVESNYRGSLSPSTSQHPAKADGVAEELRLFWRTAVRCRVCPTIAPWRKFPPRSRGSARFGLMIVGEAPGRVSLENRRPFSNPRNLTVRNAFARAVAPSKIEPERLFYFSDVVKCWPASRSGANRSPTPAETATCISRHLMRELAIVRPRVIFAFGARAASAVVGRTVRISELHGKVVRAPGGCRVIVLMHPSTINIAGMRRVGVTSLADYEEKLAILFRAEIVPLIHVALNSARP
jgi:uracil-DNA glycosylase family 4